MKKYINRITKVLACLALFSFSAKATVLKNTKETISISSYKPQLQNIGIDSTKNYRVIYKGKKGPGKGKNIVFIATDHEYRGEETLPALARILAKRFGFTCTVIWALDQEGYIHPGSSNIMGLEALDKADLLVLFTRFANFPSSQMKHLDNYLNTGKPVIGLRTSTHAFNNKSNLEWAHYDYKYEGDKKDWHGGFGDKILGETWVGHYGKNHQQSSQLILDPTNESHPILSGVKDVFVQCGGYKAFPQGNNLKIIARGRILNGMTPDSSPDKTKEEMPVAWVRKYQMKNGASGNVFTTTHGASEDILNPGFRRMLINACFWTIGLEDKINPNSNIDFVGKYTPSTFSFKGYKTKVKPSDLKGYKSVIMPGIPYSKKD